MKLVRSASVLVVLLAAGSSARASGPNDALAGDRSYAMGGAHRGLGTSNDTLFLNPAGMAAVRRYGLDIDYGRTGVQDQQFFSFSIVDSKSGPVAGGLAFSHQGSGAFSGGANHLYLGAAYAISDAIAFGFNVHNVRGGYDDFAAKHYGVNGYSGDVGLMLTLGEVLGLGVSYTNVWRTGDSDTRQLLPQVLGFGIGSTLGLASLAVDLTVPTNSNPSQYGGTAFHAGLEYFAAGLVPVRLGYSHQRTTQADGSNPVRNYLSGGLGWATPGGAIEISYRRALEAAKDWGFLGALKLFI
jgi:hypothetical protein